MRPSSLLVLGSCGFSSLLFSGLGCSSDDVPAPVDSTEVRTDEVVATFEVVDDGRGRRLAKALLVQAGPAHPDSIHVEPRAHVRIIGTDALSVRAGPAASKPMQLVSDDHEKFHYEASFDVSDGDDFAFELTRGTERVISTVTIVKPFQIVEPQTSANVPLSAPFVFRLDEARVPSDGKVDGSCVSSHFSDLLFPVLGGGVNDSYTVNLNGTSSPPCDATFELRFVAKGQIAPELSKVDVSQTSSIMASQVRTVPVRIVSGQ